MGVRGVICPKALFRTPLSSIYILSILLVELCSGALTRPYRPSSFKSIPTGCNAFVRGRHFL